MRQKLSFGRDSGVNLKKIIARYYKCANILFSENNSKEFKCKLQYIINKQNNDGCTPLHFASQEWPQNIVKSLLSLGADLSIRDNKKNYALKNIPESTILEVLDFHCMKSSFDLGKNGLSDKLISEKGSDNALYNEDNMEEEEEEEYQSLLSDY